MNNFDVIVLIIVIVFALRGAWRGFVTELATIIGIIAGYFVALAYQQFLTQLLLTYFPSMSETVSRIISLSLLFIATNLIVRITAGIITRTLKLAMLGWLNRVGGAIFASGKAIVILSIVILLVDLIPFAQVYFESFGLQDSFFYPLLRKIGPELYGYFKTLSTTIS